MRPAIMAGMSDSPEHPTESTGPVPAQTVTAAPQQPYKQSRLNQVAAWVGIVAGSVFVVAVIFGAGFMVGKLSGPPFPMGPMGQFKHAGPPPFPMGPMGPMGQLERGPFVFPGPGFPPPQPPQAPDAPTTSAPARP